MSLSRLLLLAIPLTVVACAATSDEPADDFSDQSEDALTGTLSDVSEDYVGAYAPAANQPATDVTSLRLRKDRTYTIRQAGATEEGTYVVRKGSSPTAELRLTRASSSYRTFKVALADGFRPELTLTRLRKTSRLQRGLTSCASVNCLSGMGCDVVETDGVPGPVCNPRTAAWKAALASYDLWGADFGSVIPGTYGSRSTVNCGIKVSAAQITCGTVGWNGWAVTAMIGADGSFLTGTPQGDDNYLAGRVGDDGQVTLTAWRKKECYSVPSGTFCDGKSTDRSGAARPYEMCRTRDLVFQSGGWASGYYKNCSACQPDDACTRYPAQ